MKSRNETLYTDVKDSTEFIIASYIRANMHTAIPAIVENFDANTKRIQAKPAIKLKLTNGETLSKPLLLDVPVIFPSGGGYTFFCNLVKNDSVLIIFSERGIENFKKSFNEENPTDTSFYAVTDAIAIAGFGSLNITPATTSGISLQKEDGTTKLTIEDNAITLHATNVTLQADSVSVSGNLSVNGHIQSTGEVTGAGIALSTHTHGGVSSGGSQTLPPTSVP